MARESTPLWVWLTVALMAIVAWLPTDVAAGHFSNMFVFGDSLSDTGNAFALTTFLSQIPGSGVTAPEPPSPPVAQKQPAPNGAKQPAAAKNKPADNQQPK